MRILIDTHILIWHLEGDAQLSPASRLLISDPTNSTFVSIASLWEIAIKTSRGKLSLSRPIDEIFAEINRSTVSILSIELDHALKVSSLPFHHKDPFDRLIIAQAIVDDISVISTDRNFLDYEVTLL